MIIGYLPKAHVSHFASARLQGLTELIAFSMEPPADGFSPFNSPFTPHELSQYQKIKQDVGCKLLFCVGGGARSENFPELTANTDARQHFVGELVSYCKENDFDGVDYDWEHPEGDQNSEQHKNYKALIQDTKEEMSGSNMIVTLAQAAWQPLQPETYEIVDRVHLMSYDHTDYPQATMDKAEQNIDTMINARGCPAKKIALGVPFYGRAENYSDTAKYSDLISRHPHAYHKDIIEGYALNGRPTIIEKTRLAKERGLAGIMIWQVGQDTVDPETSLLAAIVSATAEG
ncbi:MAG: glycoside hydrolase family 18 protein [Cyanobacteria bacterium P01_H01_bin.15]